MESVRQQHQRRVQMVVGTIRSGRPFLCLIQNNGTKQWHKTMAQNRPLPASAPRSAATMPVNDLRHSLRPPTHLSQIALPDAIPATLAL